MREVTCVLGGTVEHPARGSALSVPKNSCWYSPICLNWDVHSENKLKSARGTSASRALLKSYCCWWSACALVISGDVRASDPALLWPDQQLTPGLPYLGVPGTWGCSCPPSHVSTGFLLLPGLLPTRAAVDSLCPSNSQRKIIQLCLHLDPDPHRMWLGFAPPLLVGQMKPEGAEELYQCSKD